jgi:hypothetical protein
MSGVSVAVGVGDGVGVGSRSGAGPRWRRAVGVTSKVDVGVASAGASPWVSGDRRGRRDGRGAVAVDVASPSGVRSRSGRRRLTVTAEPR